MQVEVDLDRVNYIPFVICSKHQLWKASDSIVVFESVAQKKEEGVSDSSQVVILNQSKKLPSCTGRCCAALLYWQIVREGLYDTCLGGHQETGVILIFQRSTISKHSNP
jgi:hypothetical protein